ncbi:MAG: helix-turn-helix domain-containing protein [Muribaculum sp.]|nr:helix-turn-helix domain-containing protein [Muribaculum sp.]
MAKDINRLKVVLAEKKRTNKWLAEQLHKDPATVSKWCTNVSQPSIETLLEIARVLEVDVPSLLLPTAQDSNMIYVKIPKGDVIS